MDNTENNVVNEEIISALNEMIELHEQELVQLTEQTAYQAEIINGLSLIVNYQFTLVGVLVVGAVIACLWNIFNKWFFRGV